MYMRYFFVGAQAGERASSSREAMESFGKSAASGGGDEWGTNPDIWLAYAEKLLSCGDFVGAKTLAERALHINPLIDGAENYIAVADVLLAAQRDRVDSPRQIDWYAVLQLDPSTSSADASAIRNNFRRLALLLRPDLKRIPYAADAYKLVMDGWSVLSDPSKKSLFDAERGIVSPPDPSGSEPAGVSDFWTACPSCRYIHKYESIYEGRILKCPNCRKSLRASALPAFWTACPACFHVYEYGSAYKGLTLRCQTCQNAFRATALPAAPPVVPGTDFYFCSWGFFPLGFETSNGEWISLLPMTQQKGSAQQLQSPPHAGTNDGHNEEDLVSRKSCFAMQKRVVDKKRVGHNSSRRFAGPAFDMSKTGSQIRSEGIDINKEWESCA